MASQITLVAYIIAVATVLAFGTVGTYVLGHSNAGNFNEPIDNWLDALYFTVTTISTVGYGDIYPVSSIARIFDIVLIVSGLGVFLGAVTTISGEFVNKRLERLSGRISGIERRMLNMHIVLIGYDMTNALIAAKLKNDRKKFIVVTGDKLTADKLEEEGYSAFVADVTLESDMAAFRLDRAKKIIIDVKDPSRTVYAALVVKALAGSENLIVVANTKEAEKHLGELGIKHIVNPASIAAETILPKLDKNAS